MARCVSAAMASIGRAVRRAVHSASANPATRASSAVMLLNQARSRTGAITVVGRNADRHMPGRAGHRHHRRRCAPRPAASCDRPLCDSPGRASMRATVRGRAGCRSAWPGRCCWPAPGRSPPPPARWRRPAGCRCRRPGAGWPGRSTRPPPRARHRPRRPARGWATNRIQRPGERTADHAAEREAARRERGVEVERGVDLLRRGGWRPHRAAGPAGVAAHRDQVGVLREQAAEGGEHRVAPARSSSSVSARALCRPGQQRACALQALRGLLGHGTRRVQRLAVRLLRTRAVRG